MKIRIGLLVGAVSLYLVCHISSADAQNKKGTRRNPAVKQEESTVAPATMVHGAGAIRQGSHALGVGLGFDFPEPLIYGVTYDYGLTDRLQLGAAGSFAGFIGSVGLRSLYTFYKSPNAEGGRFYGGAGLFPSFIYLNALVADVKLFTLAPRVIGELRLGSKKEFGIYGKLGTEHTYARVGIDGIGGFTADGWAHQLRIGIGGQAAFTERIGGFLEVGSLVFFSGGPLFMNKIGVVFAF